MKSGKQKRLEIKAKRKQKTAKIQSNHKQQALRLRPVLGPPVNEALLAPNNSYGEPDFVYCGYYVDRPFRCVDCGKEECGPVRSRSGGMKWRRGLFTPRRCAAGYAGAKSANRVMSLGAFIWKG